MKHFCVALFISGVFLLFANADSSATSMSCFLSTNNGIDNFGSNVSIDDANSIFAEIDDQNSSTDHSSAYITKYSGSL